ncbi:MAG: nuclear transport factor 2 family protein [Cyanobacteria bacterium P01_E01_bin.34]
MFRNWVSLGLSGVAGVSLLLIAPVLSESVSVEAANENSIATELSDELSAEAQIRQLTHQWFSAWSPGSGSIDWDAMGELFVQEAGKLLVFDDADGQVVVLESWEDYRDTWEPFMAQFSEWQIEPEGDVHVLTSGNLATTSFTLTGGGAAQDGSEISFRQRGTHVWQHRNGRWEIVHEHLTTDR